jgi:hypothetical protein
VADILQGPWRLEPPGECQVRTWDLPGGQLGMEVVRADPRIVIDGHLLAWLFSHRDLMAPWCELSGDHPAVGVLLTLTPTERPNLPVIYRLVAPILGRGWIAELAD